MRDDENIGDTVGSGDPRDTGDTGRSGDPDTGRSGATGDIGDSRDRAPETVTRVGPADYAPGAADEVTLPPSDERREAHARDLDDPADANADPDVLRDGGPTRHRGVATTTGGRRAGPASTHRRPRRPGGKVAPTTTGDATSGKFGTPAGGATSDQVSQANQVGNFTDQ